MPTDFLYSDLTYCSLCDRYFPGDDARAQHVQHATNHPKCDRCDRRFANRNSLRNHFVYSPRHHYCAVCEREFRTAAGLRMHIEYSAVHRDDSDDEDGEIDDLDEVDGWEDELGHAYFPEENARSDADIRTGRDPYAPADEYWDEDDESDFEEEQEHYHGVAPVPPSAQSHITRTADSLRVMAVNDIDVSPGSSAPSSPRIETPEPEVARPLRLAASPAPQSELAPVLDASALEQPTEIEFSKLNAAEPNHSTLHTAVRVAFTCPLCLESPNSFTATRCGHVFCTPCITHAVTTTVMCPVCRRPNGPRQLRTIYLPPLAQDA